MHLNRASSGRRALMAATIALAMVRTAPADSVNSPNITLNVDTNRAAGVGNGAGDVAVAINTITIAETTLAEYSSGTGKKITLQARPGYQFDPSSNVSIQSATIGFNGAGINAAAILTPAGISDEVLTFNLTSGTNATAQDIIRINGVKLKILSAAGAAGPAQTTMQVTTSAAGGAFTNQGIVAASIATGAADRLVFSTQPGSNQAGSDLLPTVQIVDFGGNVVRNDARTITLAIENNVGNATLFGSRQRTTVNGAAAWQADDDLRMTVASSGYTLNATHSGAAFLTADKAVSSAFDITAGLPGKLEISTQPTQTVAGGDILIAVTVLDEFNNPTIGNNLPVTLELRTNPTGATFSTATSLTKLSSIATGIAAFDATDALRITVAGSGYQIAASGVGSPVLSNAFDIVPASAATVRFVQQPANTQEDVAMSPPVTVEIVDAFGNRTGDASVVQANLLNPVCAGTLTGGAVVSSAGLATFSALVIDTPCESYTLKAAVAGLPYAESTAFQVTAAPAPPVETPRPSPAPLCGGGAVATLAPMALMAFALRRRVAMAAAQ